MDTMDTMGRHVIAELWDCDFDKLNDMPYIEQLFVDAALRAGAEVREVAFHKFAPQGVSGVVIISESHLTIHSFPEHGYASIDVYTCGDRIDPKCCCRIYCRRFKTRKTRESIELPRGTGSFEIKQRETKAL